MKSMKEIREMSLEEIKADVERIKNEFPQLASSCDAIHFDSPKGAINRELAEKEYASLKKTYENAKEALKPIMKNAYKGYKSHCEFCRIPYSHYEEFEEADEDDLFASILGM